MTQTIPRSVDEYGYPTRPDSQRKLRNFVVRTSKRVVLSVVYILMSMIGVFLRLTNKKMPPLTSPHFQPRRILVIRLDLIGDLVLSLTVVRALKRRYPEAEIDLLATPSSAKIAACDPDLAGIITYDPNIWRRPQALLQARHWREVWALSKRLQARRYDLAVNVFGWWASILAVLSGAERRLGFEGENYPGFMTDTVPGRHWDPRDHKHEVDYCMELCQAAGVQTDLNDRIPSLFVDTLAKQQVEQLLQQEGLRPGKPVIACHVSANNGQSKRWPIPYWVRLIDRLLLEEGANVVLTGAHDDLPLIETILHRTQARPINMADKTNLSQLAALLEYADLLITGDSGPMHIAAAVGTPLIALHGPTDPALSGPVSSKAKILRSDIWCSPCYKARGPADCRFFTTQCMKDITPDQVFQSQVELVHE